MKWINSLEKKWFPKLSVYQRIRRRRIIFFSALGTVVLVIGVKKVITTFSNAEGSKIRDFSVHGKTLNR